MSYKITYRPEAELDIEETVKWYETQRVDLGFEFINEVEKKGEIIEENPFQLMRFLSSTHPMQLDSLYLNA